MDNKLSQEKVSDEKFFIGRFIDDYFGLIIICLSLAIIIALSLLLVFPRYLKAENRYSEAEKSVVEEKDSLLRYKAQLIKYKESFLAISDIDKNKIKDIIGTSPNYTSIYRTDLMINYRDLLLEYGYDIDYIRVEEAAKFSESSKSLDAPQDGAEVLPDGIAPMRVKLKVLAINYPRLRELLGLLETELRLADVIDLSCEEGIESCELSFDTYYFALPEAAAPVVSQ